MSQNLALFIHFLILVFASVVVGSMVKAYLSAAPWCPTRREDWDRIIKLADIKTGDLVYDFGSGDGRVVIYLGRKTQAKIIGLEYSLPFYFWSKVKVMLSGTRNVQIKQADFYKQDISQADVVFCFLTPKAMRKLTPKFKKELKQGAKVISYAFKLSDDWQPTLRDKPGKKNISVYVYKKS